MATKIKLMRLGKMRAPYYRIVVADARTKRDGRVIETIGKYHPKENPSFIQVDAERAAYWLSVGAQATDPVERILKVTGDWQKFKGEAAPAPMLVAEPRVDKRVAFEAAAREGLDGAASGAATTPKKKAAPKAAPTAEAKPADDKPAEDKSADVKPAEDKPADVKPVDDKSADVKPADVKPVDDKSAEDKPAGAKPAQATPAPQAEATPDSPASPEE